MYKSLEDVKLVIELKKPLEVIEAFIASYLQGLAYEAWADGKDLEETREVVTVDDECNEVTTTELVNVYEEVDVSAQVVKWKLANYAMLRAPLYPYASEYLDAVVKGDEVAIEAYKEACLAVKAKYPK